MKGTESPSAEQMREIQRLFREHGMKAKIGSER
jgi:hypothetical protein